MVYGMGNKCVKYMVFIFNFLVFVVGIVVLALSLSIRFSNAVQDYFQKLIQPDSGIDLGKMYIALYVLAAVGAMLILMGFLGCCGAWTENSCLLSLFFSIILILFIAELGCGIAVLVNKDGFKNQLFTAIQKQVARYYKDLPKEEKDAIDNMQTKLQCCGCYNATADYGKLGPFPDSCGGGIPPRYQEGCCNKVWNDAESQLGIVGGVSIGILVIELLAMIFSCILCQAFRRGDYQYA